jgi:hypothetical protein
MFHFVRKSKISTGTILKALRYFFSLDKENCIK